MAKANTIIVLALLIGWLLSGIVLWQFKLVGPRWSNAALLVHDLLTWVGLPYIIYHSITRTRWLKDPARRTIQTNEPSMQKPTVIKPVAPNANKEDLDTSDTPAATSILHAGKDSDRNNAPNMEKPQPVYTRRAFIRSAVGIGLAVTLGPTFVSWVGKTSNLITA